MAEQPVRDYGREVRDTIVKSGLTGVAATVLAVTVFSPAGLGGMVGTSLASGFSLDNDSAPADGVYASLPAYPSALSQEELNSIQSELARSAASLEITRAATEAKIEHIRAIALTEGVVTFAAMPQVIAAPAPADLRVTSIEPVETAVVDASAEATFIPAGGGGVDLTGYRNSHLELAELMFEHENF